MASGTKYIHMKRCMNCWYVCEFWISTCPSCKHLFICEATVHEKDKRNEEMAALIQKKLG